MLRSDDFFSFHRRGVEMGFGGGKGGGGGGGLGGGMGSGFGMGGSSMTSAEAEMADSGPAASLKWYLLSGKYVTQNGN